LLARRLPVLATLRRSSAEFATLLTIPATDLLTSGALDAYVVMGKGVDMAA